MGPSARYMGPRQEFNTSEGNNNVKSFDPFMNSKEEDTTLDSLHPKFSEREGKAEDSILASSHENNKKNAIIVSGEDRP